MHLLLALVTLYTKYCIAIQTHHVFYWPIWPYIRPLNGTIYSAEGIIPEVIERVFIYCQLDGLYQFKYHNSFANYAEYTTFIKSNFTRGQGLLQEVSTNIAIDNIWFGPFISPEISNVVHPWINNAIRTVEAPGAHVLVDRRLVSWRHKMYQGVKNSINYLVLALMMSVCFGTFVFLIESHLEETEFGSTFPEGVWNGFWWSTVTMTTIGYGDIVPKSILGRSLGLFWLLFGILIGSIITATVTDSMFSSDHLNINNKKVAVVANSWEENIAKGYKAQIKALNSYEEVIQAVRDGDVFAALINSDIVRWKQEEITSGKNPLAIVDQHQRGIPIKMTGQIQGNASLWACVQQHKEDIYDTPQNKYFLNINVAKVHYVSLEELLIDDWLGLTLLIITSLTVLVVIIFLIIEKCIIKRKLHLRDVITSIIHRPSNKPSDVEMNNPRYSIKPESPLHHSIKPESPLHHGNYNPYARRHSRIPYDPSKHRNSSFGNIGFNGLNSNVLELRVINIEDNITDISEMLQKLIQIQTTDSQQKSSPNHQRLRDSVMNNTDLSGVLMY